MEHEGVKVLVLLTSGSALQMVAQHFSFSQKDGNYSLYIYIYIWCLMKILYCNDYINYQLDALIIIYS